MRVVVQDAVAFKWSIEAIVNLVEEGQFELSKDGISLKALDPSQISMVCFSMPRKAFSEYDIEGKAKLGLDISQFSKILSRGKNEESVLLGAEEGRLVISFSGKGSKRTFKIPLRESLEAVQREPSIEYGNCVKINSDALKDVLRDVKLLSSHIRFSLSEKKLVVEARGDSGDVESEFTEGAEIADMDVKEEATATFPLQYLEDIVKASEGGSLVSLYIKTDKPLKVEYNIKDSSLVYYLAPRMEG